jgi:DNA-binding CsgD family transcriptional regulator
MSRLSYDRRTETVRLQTTVFAACVVDEAAPTGAASHPGARALLRPTLLAEEAHEELIATGARPRRVELSGAAALTPSKRRIAAMAAEWLPNREIAQALFVTLRTVEMQLSNAFRKLDVSSRTQLSAALADGQAPVAAGARPEPPTGARGDEPQTWSAEDERE